MNITIGADPEVFVSKAGKAVSAFGLIPGTKETPHRVNKGAVQVDGMALEFNIDPASSEDEFSENMAIVMDQLQQMVPGHIFYKNCVARFDPKYMASQPEEALELGCDPDYNAYTGQANPRPDGNVSFRTAGGHVHVGWGQDIPVEDAEHQEACQMLARELDFYLGLPSLAWDKNTERRNMYGKAGAYRAKSYGMEYRSLSNAWLANDDRIRFVYRMTRRAVENLMNGFSIYESMTNTAQVAIDNSDEELAREIVKLFPEHLEMYTGE